MAPSRGTLLCLASAVAFGAMGIFGKLAYDEGASVETALVFRFGVAALVFWAFVAATAMAGSRPAIAGRDVALGLALGGVGYAAQAGSYFSALKRLDASLLALLLYTFPAIVTVAAVLLGRERFTARTLTALALASAGLVLVLAGAGAGALDPLGTVLGLCAACVYATYILTSEPVSRRLAPALLSALVCTGAAVTLTIVGTVGGGFAPAAVSPLGYVWLTALALVSTVAAIALFFAGLRRVGPTTASILSTAEPVTTVVAAYLAFGESMTAVQLCGGALVICAVVVLSARRPPARRRPPSGRAGQLGAAPARE